MKKEFHMENRNNMYQMAEDNSLIVLFSGTPLRKTGEENYPFFADRSFVYLTGIEQKESIFTAAVHSGTGSEHFYTLPSDLIAERWTGRRLTVEEISDRSGFEEISPVSEFFSSLRTILSDKGISCLYLNFNKLEDSEPDYYAYRLAAYVKKNFPYITIKNILPIIRELRTYKKPCEIKAMKKAQTITKAGIEAMMKSSRPGMYEYQYKAEFDYALAQHGVLAPGFPSIISAGNNNFCIHYDSYRGIAADGDMILNDVGACWDNEINDVSRGWPCNGRFSEKQRMLYECVYQTSEYMFRLLKPGFIMSDVDKTIRRYNYELLKDIGLCETFEDIGTYMWHGGAHHVGYDVHDTVSKDIGKIAPGMVFCIDIGVYVEEWGIGFRLEDNCHITEDGCENLSAIVPRKIEDIEAFMGTR